MSGTFGGVACNYLRGDLCADGRQASQRWHRPGIDGDGIMLLGKTGVETELELVLYSNNAGVTAWANLIQSMQGTIITVVNDVGQSSTDVFVVQVGPCNRQTALVPGTSSTVRGEIRVLAVVSA